ncbi:Pkinase-domain-containing protein [Phanerochaete sordida]|uniref:non-specific serine/threonine protein kinase n=1 Tax=Phanerochaete sordida TaxID=48140 RepID=A0A9P3G9T9_9APHY|nr:Pkinase-domain-containing protein [Phanerochaete sordida]
MADTITASTETPQADGEGPEGSDKPPHGGLRTEKSSNHTPRRFSNGTKLASTKLAPASHPAQPPASTPTLGHVPLPPPDSHSYPKSPERTRKDLQQIELGQELEKLSMNGSAPAMNKKASSSTTGSITPSTSESPSASESESWSLPSTQPPSRAPSFSAGKAGGKVSLDKGDHREPEPQPLKKSLTKTSVKSKDSSKTPTTRKVSPTPSRESTKEGKKGPPSVHSDSGGQKFTLKDLLGAPKLVRRSSARSTGSSKKSGGSDGGRSVAGESTTASLLKKYGVCEKVAIGRGATSVVRLAHKWDRSEEKLYAVKEFRKRRKNETEKEYVKKLTAEFCISSTLHHINIVETVDLVQDESNHWCEVMEFCPGGDLYAAIKRGGMSPAEVECCFRQILTGVHYLHSQGVAHRDIKPENLFFDTKGHLKIGDYGASTVYRLPWETTIHMSTGLCGSEPYIAPEQFLGKPYDARLVDIWACGIVYYCLHFQELPWTVAQPTDALFSAYVQACQSTVPTQSQCPPTINNLSPRACRPLIRKMLEPNPKLRCSIEDAVNNSWVQAIDVCYLTEKPSHKHVYAQSMVESQVQVLGS